MQNTKTILRGSENELTVSQNIPSEEDIALGSDPTISNIHTVRWMKVGLGFHKKELIGEVKIDLTCDNSTDNIRGVQDYLRGRLEPDAIPFGRTELRFNKLKIGNDVLKMLQNNCYDHLEELYNQAVKLEGDGFGYPEGKLGQLLIDLKCERDKVFKEHYWDHRMALASVALG